MDDATILKFKKCNSILLTYWFFLTAQYNIHSNMGSTLLEKFYHLEIKCQFERRKRKDFLLTSALPKHHQW